MSGLEIARRLSEAPETILEITRLAQECARDDGAPDAERMARDPERAGRARDEACRHMEGIGRLVRRIEDRIK